MLSPRVMGIRLRYFLLFILLTLVFIYYYGHIEGPAKANVAGLQPIVSNDGRVSVQSPLIFIGMVFGYDYLDLLKANFQVVFLEVELH